MAAEEVPPPESTGGLEAAIPKKQQHAEPPATDTDAPPVVPAPAPAAVAAAAVIPPASAEPSDGDKGSQAPASSGYAMTSHSAELIVSDHYLSSGSDESSVEGDDGDENEGGGGSGGISSNKLDAPVDILLASSKMGLMRRTRGERTAATAKTWVRGQDNKDGAGGGGDGADQGGAGGDGSAMDIDGEGDAGADGDDVPATTAAEQAAKEAAAEAERKREEEELAALDPAERAARLMAQKAAKLEEAKAKERRLISEENAGRDPCLFSKRTAFDIRMDQIEDKPWNRGGDITDYFNYGMGEEDWLEYSEFQMAIRQELTDASKQSRRPDPTLVPVIPRAPRKQQPRVAVAVKKKKKQEDDEEEVDLKNVPGPQAVPNAANADGSGGDGTKDGSSGGAKVKKEGGEGAADDGKDKKEEDDDIGAGAWGAGAAPGSMLARLIEEQEQRERGNSRDIMGDHPPLANMAARRRTATRLMAIRLIRRAEASLLVVDSAVSLEVGASAAEALLMGTGGVVVAREGEALVVEEGSAAEEEDGSY